MIRISDLNFILSDFVKQKHIIPLLKQPTPK